MQLPKVQSAKPSDYTKLINLWESSVRATHAFLGQKDIETYKLLIHDYYFDQVDLYYLSDSGQMIGFIGLKKDFIQMLFIHPRKIGKGYGKRLINFAITHHSAKMVDVNEQNTSALGFYRKLGFKIVERSETDAAGKPFPVISLSLAG